MLQYCGQLGHCGSTLLAERAAAWRLIGRHFGDLTARRRPASRHRDLDEARIGRCRPGPARCRCLSPTLQPISTGRQRAFDADEGVVAELGRRAAGQADIDRPRQRRPARRSPPPRRACPEGPSDRRQSAALSGAGRSKRLASWSACGDADGLPAQPREHRSAADDVRPRRRIVASSGRFNARGGAAPYGSSRPPARAPKP